MPDQEDRGPLLFIDEVSELTRMPVESIRHRYHRGLFPPLWKQGRRLVAWREDVLDWMDQQKAATSKTSD